MSHTNCIDCIWLHIKIVFYIVLILFLFPLVILLILIPFSIYRFIVILCFNSTFKDGRILTATDAFLASDDIFHAPYYNLVGLITLDSVIDVENLKSRFSELLERRNGSGIVVFAKMRQSVTRFMGYNFWKTDANFRVDTQFKIYDEDMNIATLEKLKKELAVKPWTPGRPLWEFIIVKNLLNEECKNRTPTSFLMFRVHHTLADGYGFHKILLDGLLNVSLEKLLPRPTILPPKVSLFQYITLPIRALYEFASELARPKKSHLWNRPNKELRRIDKLAKGIMPVSTLKKIRMKYEVSLTSVIHAGVCGAIRRAMEEKNVEVPEEVEWYMIMFRGDRSEDITNHSQICSFRLPTGTENPELRLMKTEKEYTRLKTSMLPTINFYIGKTLGTFFPKIFLRKFMTSNSPQLGGISTFAGPAEMFPMCDANVTDFTADGGAIIGQGIAFICDSYNGRLQVRIGVDKSVGNFELSKDLVRYFEDEINQLT